MFNSHLDSSFGLRRMCTSTWSMSTPPRFYPRLRLAERDVSHSFPPQRPLLTRDTLAVKRGCWLLATTGRRCTSFPHGNVSMSFWIIIIIFAFSRVNLFVWFFCSCLASAGIKRWTAFSWRLSVSVSALKLKVSLSIELLMGTSRHQVLNRRVRIDL